MDPETLKRWGKPIRPDALLRAVRRCRGAGIETAVGYILWHERSTPRPRWRRWKRCTGTDCWTPKPLCPG
jgi:hypothetical protein